MASVRAVYHVRCDGTAVERVARGIAVEQTVECPASLISPMIEDQVVGKVMSIAPIANKRFAITLDYSADQANGQLPQLLNLVYGNISLKDSIRLADLILPDEIVARFRGPKFGVAKLRALTGVYDRPLLGAVLKPRGVSDEALAKMAGDFALGGGDIVKDDHNLVAATVDEFHRRVGLCHAAVEAANAATGRNCVYLCNLSAPFDQLAEQMECALSLGVRGVMVAPMALGLDTVRHLSETRPLIMLAHPTFTGTFFHDRSHGIEPRILLGTLFRLAGADISIIPTFGGRLSFTRAECTGVAQRLRQSLGSLKPTLPAPAGGLRFEAIADTVSQYGADALFLIGGALLTHGPSLRHSTTAYLNGIRQYFTEHLTEPRRDLVSTG